MATTPDIIPHLWFESDAVKAAELYCTLFPDSKILSRGLISDTPSGDCETVSFQLWGQRIEAIAAGPPFRFNPSLSFMVNYDPLCFPDAADPLEAAKEKLNEAWAVLSQGGQALMELGVYDFSPRYGWVQDRYGLSWQLILTDVAGDPRPPIMPALLFVGDQYTKCEEAGRFYREIFPDSQNGQLFPYPPEMESEKEGAVMFSDFRLGSTWIVAMDSGYDHGFQFNEAFSFMVFCKDQVEIDRYWKALSAYPEAEQCGWLKDRYGISWQIVPKDFKTFMESGTEAQNKAVTRAFLGMKKFDIAALKRTFEDAG